MISDQLLQNIHLYDDIKCIICFRNEEDVKKEDLNNKYNTSCFIQCSKGHNICKICICNQVNLIGDPESDIMIEVLGGINKMKKSPAGSFPCLYFSSGLCECESISADLIIPLLAGKMSSNGNSSLILRFLCGYENGVIANQHELRTSSNFGNEHKILSYKDNYISAVKISMSLGQKRICICMKEYRKDNACMHMTCLNKLCAFNFCYICGRGIQDCPRGMGCDAESSFIEHNSGWMHLTADEALIEFHYRLITFNVSIAKILMGDKLWNIIIAENPDLLENAVAGRSIVIPESLQDYFESLLFGNTKIDPTKKRKYQIYLMKNILSELIPKILDIREKDTESNQSPLSCKLEVFQKLTETDLNIAEIYMRKSNYDIINSIELWINDLLKKDIDSFIDNNIYRIYGSIIPEIIGDYIDKKIGFNNNRRIYQQIGGNSHLYWKDGYWRIINNNNLTDHCYQFRSDEMQPYIGEYISEGNKFKTPPIIERLTKTDNPARKNGVIIVKGAGDPKNLIKDVFENKNKQIFGGKEIFKNIINSSIIYWNPKYNFWCINDKYSPTGWYYSQVGYTYPPEGFWTNEGYGKIDVYPAPFVYHLGLHNRPLYRPKTIKIWHPREQDLAFIGTYERNGEHNQYPQYIHNSKPYSIIFDKNKWLLTNYTSKKLISQVLAEDMIYPPEGLWDLEDRDLSLILEYVESESFKSLDDCEVGMRVQILPEKEAKPHTRSLGINWSFNCSNHAEMIGYVCLKDYSDNSIQVRFNDGKKCWVAVPSCTINPQPFDFLPSYPIQIWVTGAGNAGIFCCGRFDKSQTDQHSNRPIYYNGDAIIYFDRDWKLSPKNILTGWMYCHILKSIFPPQGEWTSEGYTLKDNLPVPKLFYTKNISIKVSSPSIAVSSPINSLLGDYVASYLNDGKPLYYKINQKDKSIIKFDNRIKKWCIYNGIFTIYKDSDDIIPPEGLWLTDSKDFTISVTHQPSKPIPEKIYGGRILSNNFCTIGEEISILPFKKIQNPKKYIKWTEEMFVRCGQDCVIKRFKPNNIVDVEFLDGKELSYPITYCCKSIETSSIDQIPLYVTFKNNEDKTHTAFYGIYEKCGVLNDYPKYRLINGHAIIYFSNNMWKINIEDDIKNFTFFNTSKSLKLPLGKWSIKDSEEKINLPDLYYKQ